MPVKIFFCYAHEDEAILNKLKTHLRALERQGLIDMWHDRDIRAGIEWEEVIKDRLSTSQIILLLVSPDFMDSDYCYSTEMKQALQRHEQRGAQVIPIILRPVYWQGAPFGKLQALPTDAKPVMSSSWAYQDEAFYNITEGIRKVVDLLTSRQPQLLSGTPTPVTQNSPLNESMPTMDMIPHHTPANPSESFKPALLQSIEPSRSDDALSSGERHPVNGDNKIMIAPTSYQNQQQVLPSIEEMEDEINYVGKLVGLYQIEREIGRGGLGRVYLARYTDFPNRIVAIKLFYSHLSTVQKEGLLFQQVRLREKLKHPYILPIIDVGSDEKSHYIVTEYASRGSLRDRIQHHYPHPLPVREAITILFQIGQALAHIHQLDIVHRDLKPANILFNDRDEAQLADFDLAVVRNIGDTKKVNIMGSPPYMAPEQFEGTVSRQSDQYALGCLAYELCTGRRAFDSPNFLSMQFKHTVEKPIPPRQFNQELPTHIEAAILKAMAKNASDRFSDSLAFVSALTAT